MAYTIGSYIEHIRYRQNFFVRVGHETTYASKGQIISKQRILGFFQKTNKRICFFWLTVLKTNLFVRFLEESEDTKNSFRNYLTFS